MFKILAFDFDLVLFILVCRLIVTKVEIIQSQMLVCLRCNLATLQLLQLGRMLRLRQCTMEMNIVLQQLDRLKVLLEVLPDKCHHGIQTCKLADHRLFLFPAPFLVRYIPHHQVARCMPQHLCLRAHHQCISQVLHRICDQVVRHPQVFDLLVLHLLITANPE